MADLKRWFKDRTKNVQNVGGGVLRQVNILDNNQTYKQRTPTQAKSSFQQAGQLGGQVSRGVVGSSARFLNTAEATRQQIAPTFKGVLAQASNNPVALSNAISQQNRLRNQYYGKNKGILGTGTFVTADEAMRGDPKTILARTGANTLETGLELASLGTGGFAGKELVTQGFKQGFKSQVPNIVKSGTLNTAQGGIHAFNEGVRDPKEILKQAAIGGTLGTAADIGLGVGAAGISKLVKGSPEPTIKISNKPRISDAELDNLKNYSDYLMGLETPNNRTSADAYVTAKKAGLDITSGSRAARAERINQLLDREYPVRKAKENTILQTNRVGKAIQRQLDGEPKTVSDLNPLSNQPTIPKVSQAQGKSVTSSRKSIADLFKDDRGSTTLFSQFGKDDPLEALKAEARKNGEEIVFHRTSKANADRIMKTGKMFSKENTGEIFTSNRPDGQISGYGDTVVPIRVKKSDLRLDDEFPSGEKHFAVKSDKVTPVSDLYNQATKPDGIKSKQLDFINKNNPMTDSYHTGIRSVNDIKTFEEAFNDPESFAYPDFNKQQAKLALDNGKITVYSSKPLDNASAQFVTPSKMGASDYAGGGKVYSKEVKLSDVAWINGDEGQLVGSTKKKLFKPLNDSGSVDPESPILFGVGKLGKNKDPKAPQGKTDQTFYHGGTPVNKDAIRNSELGYSVSSNKNVSKWFTNTKNGGKITEHSISPNAKILTTKDIPQELIDNFTKLDPNKSVLENIQQGATLTKEAEKKLVAYARANGYDAIDMRGEPFAIKGSNVLDNEAELRILNPDILDSNMQKTPPNSDAFVTTSTHGRKASDSIPQKQPLGEVAQQPTQVKVQKNPQAAQPTQTKNIPQPIQDQPRVPSVKPLNQASSPDRATLKAPEIRQRTPLPQQSEEIFSGLPQRKSSTNKLQQKTPVVNEAKRAIDGADRTTYGLRDSFDTNENVPKELKEALGAFGNERTVRSNKELWQTAQKRVVDDPAEAMRFFKDNNSDDAVATGYALINRNMKEGNVTAAGEISIEMAERALETGRTNQAYALMKRLTPEGSISYVEKKVQRFIRDNPNMAKKVGWDDKVRKELYEMADQVNKLPEGRERNLAIGKMQEKIDNIFPSSLADKAVTVWKAGLLTSLRTHERNILGNTINMVGEQSATVPGSLADRIMSLRTGKRTLTATPGRNMGSGAKVGGQIAKDQIMTGIDVNNTNIKYNINHVTWGDNKVEKVLKGYTEGVFRPLGAEDKIFKESIRANSLYNQAAAQAKTKGLKGDAFDNFVQEKIKNPTAKMMDIADDDASRGTFTHDNFLGDIIKNAKGAVRRSNKPGAKAMSAFLDILMPFTQVPSGVASQLYAYSPAKLIKSSYDIGKVLVTGNETLQRQAAQGFGRSVIGTSIIGAGAYLAANGLMTGDPKDDAEKAQWEAQGIKPNSVKIGDRWYGLQSVGPQFVLALAGAQMVADQENGDNPYTKLAANIGNNFSEQTFIKGMSSFVDAIKEPERNLDFYVQSQATSVVPNILKDITKAIDPNERQTNSVWDKFKGSIPGVSNDLPERKDSYGQTIKNSGALEIVDLFNSSKEKDIPEAKYIDALRASTGEKDHVPTKADKTITINGENKKLNSKEYSEYQSYIGSMGKQVIGRLKDDPAFRALPETEQVKKIDNALKDINSAAKIKLFGNDPKDSNSNVKKMVDGQYPTISTKITSASGEEIPQNINQSAKRILESDTGEAAWLTQDSNEQEVKDTLSSWLPQGVERPRITNDIAKQWANLEKKRAEGTLGNLEFESEKKTILKNAYNSDLTEDEKDLYSLSEEDLKAAWENGTLSDDNINRALAVEKKLYDAGLISKESLARKLDLTARGYKSGKGKKGGKGSKQSVSDIMKSLTQPDIGTPKKSTMKNVKATIPKFKVATPNVRRPKRDGRKGIKVTKTKIA